MFQMKDADLSGTCILW